MNTNELLEEIKNLKVDEKLNIVEKIWQDIADQNATPPLTEWQQKELKKRYKEYQQQALKLHESESVHEELRSKYK